MTITVCMGSSCFSRGNASNAQELERLVGIMGIANKVVIKGCLCEGQCKKGPTLRVNDTVYSGVTPDSLEDILQHELSLEEGERS